MNRDEVIRRVKGYFEVSDLVCPHTYNKWGERSWQFLDREYLHALLVLRTEVLNAPMICNTGRLRERGLRCNLCETVRKQKGNYVSAHVMGKGGDFSIIGMTAGQAREVIRSSADTIPYPFRMERQVGWLHIDVFDTGRGRRLTEFDA